MRRGPRVDVKQQTVDLLPTRYRDPGPGGTLLIHIEDAAGRLDGYPEVKT